MSYVELRKPDGWEKRFPANYDEARDRYKVLAEVVASAQEGDAVRFYGAFEGGRHDWLDLTKLAYFGGYLRQFSNLLMTSQIDPDGQKPGGVAITLGANTTVEHCTLRNIPANPDEDGGLIGLSLKGEENVTLRDVRLVGQDWTFYRWGSANFTSKVLIEDCTIEFARQGVSQVASNATNSHWTIRRTAFIGDANRSQTYGATSIANPDTGGVLAGVVFRAGVCEIEDCTFDLTGLIKNYNTRWNCPRIAAVTDHFYSTSSKAVKINVRNSRVVRLVPGTAVQVRDIDQRFGTITWDNSELVSQAKGGTGEGGELRQ